MPRMEMATTNRVIARDRFGLFIKNAENAAGEVVRELIEEGMNISRAMAPVGPKHDRRTVPLRDSIFMVMETNTRGYWGSSARHALPTEFGARPHQITGDLFFFWEREGRNWIPSEKYYGIEGMEDVINHPGHGAQPFLGPAYDIIRGKMQAKLRAKYGRI